MKNKIFGWICVAFLLMGCSVQTEVARWEMPIVNRDWQYEGNLPKAGEVVLSDIIELSFPIAGMVDELLVREGDQVQLGQVLARLDATEILAEIDQAESTVAVMEANYQKVLAGAHESQIAEAESKLAAIAGAQALNKSQATVQAAELASAQAQLDFLKAQPFPQDLAVAKAEVDQARVALEATRARLTQAELEAPMDGTITEIVTKAHEFAWIGQTILKISNTQHVNVEVILSDIEVTEIQEGDRATVNFDAIPELELQAIVISIVPLQDKENPGMFLVKLHLIKVPDQVRWGMVAEVYFPK